MKILLITLAHDPENAEVQIGANTSEFWNNLDVKRKQSLSFDTPDYPSALDTLPKEITLTERMVKHATGRHEIVCWMYTNFQGTRSEATNKQVKTEITRRAEMIFDVVKKSVGVLNTDAVIVHGPSFPKAVIPEDMRRDIHYINGGFVDNFARAVQISDPSITEEAFIAFANQVLNDEVKVEDFARRYSIQALLTKPS